MRLSIIIPVLNDNKQVNQTIASIKSTVVLGEVEVIVIDDVSDTPVVLENFDPLPVVFMRNTERIGAGGSRHLGAEVATGDYILLLDSHMRFEPGWYQKAMERISAPGREMTVHCGSCLGLDNEDMNIEEYPRHTLFSDPLLDVGRKVNVNGEWGRKRGDTFFEIEAKGKKIVREIKPGVICTVPASARYHGAILNLLGPNPSNPNEFQVFEGVWAPERAEDDYEISCLMGACYFFHREFFFHIGGLKANKHWGSEEPYIALKTYLTGGSVRLMKNVRIGHKFHSGSVPYSLFIYMKNYNKIRSIMTCAGETEAVHMMGFLSKEKDIKLTIEALAKDKREIMEEYKYNQDIFIHDLSWFCSKFNLKHPLSIPALK